MLHKDSEHFLNMLHAVVEQQSYMDLQELFQMRIGFTVNDPALSFFKMISENHNTPLLDVLAASRAGLRVLMLDEFLDILGDLRLCEGAGDKLTQLMSELPEKLEIMTHFEAITINDEHRKWFGQALPDNADIAFVATCWGKHEGQSETYSKPDTPAQVLLGYQVQETD